MNYELKERHELRYVFIIALPLGFAYGTCLEIFLGKGERAFKQLQRLFA